MGAAGFEPQGARMASDGAGENADARLDGRGWFRTSDLSRVKSAPATGGAATGFAHASTAHCPGSELLGAATGFARLFPDCFHLSRVAIP